MTINERVKQLRKTLGLTQVEFGKKIAVAQGYLTNIEKGSRDVTEKILKIICHEFNVSEEWLRTGQGEMFVQTESFSLDDYAKKSNLSALEYDIIRGYMGLDEETRRSILSHFASIFSRHAETAATREMDIEEEVASYRRELEQEKRTGMLSASHLESGSA